MGAVPCDPQFFEYKHFSYNFMYNLSAIAVAVPTNHLVSGIAVSLIADAGSKLLWQLAQSHPVTKIPKPLTHVPLLFVKCKYWFQGLG